MRGLLKNVFVRLKVNDFKLSSYLYIPSWKHVHHYQFFFAVKYSEPTHKLHDTSVEIIVLLYSKQTKT